MPNLYLTQNTILIGIKLAKYYFTILIGLSLPESKEGQPPSQV